MNVGTSAVIYSDSPFDAVAIAKAYMYLAKLGCRYRKFGADESGTMYPFLDRDWQRNDGLLAANWLLRMAKRRILAVVETLDGPRVVLV